MEGEWWQQLGLALGPSELKGCLQFKGVNLQVQPADS